MTAAPPQVLLAHHLETLKLPTFLREYEKVAGDCTRKGIDHPGYLLRLAELTARRWKQGFLLPPARSRVTAAVPSPTGRRSTAS